MRAMDTTRIELYEKVEDEFTDYETYLIEELNIYIPKTYSYHRINPLISEITPEEIEGNNEECIIRFSGGYKCIVRISYDELCIRLNDLENNFLESEE